MEPIDATQQMCTVEENTCLRLATTHVISRRTTYSYACAEHSGIPTNRCDAHRLVDGCLDRRSLWFPEEHTCRVPRNRAEIAIGVFILNQYIPA